MMLTAMHHTDSAASAYAYACASPSSSTSPWQHQQHQQQLLPVAARGHLRYDYDDLASVTEAAPAATTRAPVQHKQQIQQHRPARRVAKRRPRPSRRLPTTYISADPAEFRRMVQQVTGADDDALPPPHEEELFSSPALAGRAAPPVVAGGALLLPTLDTSAFLLGRAARPAAFRTETAPAPPACDGSLELDNASGSSNCGFPTLESSWDLL